MSGKSRDFVPMRGKPARVKPSRGPTPSLPTVPPRQVNTTTDTTERVQGAITGPDAISLVYGTQMVEGRVIAIGYDDASDPHYRYFFVAVTAGEIDSITEAYADGEAYPITSMTTKTGSLSQTGIAAMLAWYGGSYTFPALAYVHITQQLAYFDGVTWVPLYPQPKAPQRWQFKVKGRLIYDTRTLATAHSTNPAMCLRHFLASVTYGAGVSTSDLDEQSFKDAADACDALVNGQKRFELNLAILGQATVQQWVDTICSHFAAQLYVQDGKYRLWVDGVTTDSTIRFDTTNSRDWVLSEIPITERPSRVIVEYPRAANKYAIDKATSEDTGASTSGQTREAIYKLDGCTDPDQAQRTADYIRKAATLSTLRVTFIASPLAARLARGTRFGLTFPNGVSGTHFLVTDIEPLPNGEFRISAREYDENVHAEGTAASGPSAPTGPGSPWDTPPDVTVASWTTHEETVTFTPSQVTKHTYVALEYTLPGYQYAKELVVRGAEATSMPSDLAWDDLSDEFVIPLQGNLPPTSGVALKLYWPVAVGSDSKAYFPSMEEGARLISRSAYQVTVRLRNSVGLLSDGVLTRAAAGYSSTSGATTDPGSVLQTTQELRLVEAPANGTNYWKLKPAASLSANRTLTLPDSGAVDGVLAVDSSGNISFRQDFSFHAHKNGTSQTGITTGTATKVTFGTEEFDVGSGYDAGNSRFAPGVAGKYQINATVTMVPDASETMVKVSLYVSGSEKKAAAFHGSLDSRGLTAAVSCVLDLGASDYVEVYVYHTKSGDGAVEGATTVSHFSGCRVG